MIEKVPAPSLVKPAINATARESRVDFGRLLHIISVNKYILNGEWLKEYEKKKAHTTSRGAKKTKGVKSRRHAGDMEPAHDT